MKSACWYAPGGHPLQLEDITHHPEAVLFARQLHGRTAAYFHMQVEHGLQVSRVTVCLLCGPKFTQPFVTHTPSVRR